MKGYDPVRLAKLIEPLVARNGERKYYRFRVDRWYGGIVTGDVVGCNLRCGFCWAWRFTWGGYNRVGFFVSADVACDKLVRLAKRYGISQVRLSGGEPTIGFTHLMKVMECVTSAGLNFVLETNGIMIGADYKLAEKLASFSGNGVEVRVSIKGTNPHEFNMITRADPRAWWLQIEALRNLVEAGLRPGDEVYPAIMLSFTDEEGAKRIRKLLANIHPELARNIDPEYVILYRHVVKLLRMTGLKPRKAFRPGEVPPELI